MGIFICLEHKFLMSSDTPVVSFPKTKTTDDLALKSLIDVSLSDDIEQASIPSSFSFGRDFSSVSQCIKVLLNNAPALALITRGDKAAVPLLGIRIP